MFSARKRPQDTDPLAWKNMQDLYTGQAVRCDSQAGLWWTGITLEDCASSDLSSNMLMDIVAYPVFVKCEQESLGVKATLPLLCVCTMHDYYGHMDAFSAAWNSSLATACGNELAAYSFTPIEAVGNPVPGLLKTVAQYAGRTATQDEHYRQVTNDLSFDFQFGGNVFEGMTEPAAPYPYVLDSFQWEDSEGHHAMAGNYLEACGPDGQPVVPELGRKTQNALVACKTQNGVAPIVLTCDWNPDEDDLANWLSVCLSASEELSAADKKLVWLDRGGARGVEKYDMCPDFSAGGAINLSAWTGTRYDYANEVTEIILSSRADARVESDIEDLPGGRCVVC
jgi:hypothetical protein